MATILSFEEAIRQIVAQTVRRGRAITKDYAYPIYASVHGSPEHIGTCFFVGHGRSSYLLTAAHVIDHSRVATLYVGASGEFIPVVGNFATTEAPGGDRSQDRFDFAWLKLEGENLKFAEKCKVIASSKISKNRLRHEKRVYLSVGYPNSKNKTLRSRPAVAPCRATYYSTWKPHEKLFDSLGIDHDSHISIDYTLKALNEDFIQVNAIHPRGVSGGPLFDLGRIVSPDDLLRETPLDPMLAGMIIEYHKDHKALLAVKIDVILKCIDNARDAL